MTKPIIGEKLGTRQEIARLLGGSPQGGIQLPSGKNYIMLFSSEVGELNGYVDGFENNDPNGFFYYTGTGTSGDMSFEGNPGYRNAAIRDHTQNNKSLWVFQKIDDSWVFLGDFILVDYEWLTLPDVHGFNRRAIRFKLNQFKISNQTEPYPGEQFNTRQEIASLYGGSIQGGIQTPVSKNYIMLFSSPNGELLNGYIDAFENNDTRDVFYYTGTGSSGDMSFEGNPGSRNAAIRDHDKKGKDLWLFCKESEIWVFVGVFYYINHSWELLSDANRIIRSAIRFKLASKK